MKKSKIMRALTKGRMRGPFKKYRFSREWANWHINRKRAPLPETLYPDDLIPTRAYWRSISFRRVL